jgi:hypothetical protein
MRTARPKYWTDDQLAATLDETGEWVVDGRQGKVLCHAASLREAMHRAAHYAASGTVVIAACRAPDDNIIVFPSQMERLRMMVAGLETRTPAAILDATTLSHDAVL